MTESIFKYDKLADTSNDIRLLTLLPGEVHDPIRLRMRHISLSVSKQTSSKGNAQLADLYGTLPESWTAFEALDGRILYVKVDETGSTKTSWKHPKSTGVEKILGSDEMLQEGSDAAVVPYEALSYIWGAEEDPIEVLIRMAASPEDEDVGEVLIEIPGATNPPQYCRLAVRRNLESSLRHLRYTDTSRTLWIDAICINQADVVERSEQVARMKDIFKLAERVMIWIGPATNTSQHAMHTLEFLGRQVVHSKTRNRAPAPDSTEPTWFEATTVLPYSESTWQAIRDLLERPWFKRLWVVQEAHLARKGLFLCGNDEMDWLTFRYAVLVFWYNKASMTSWPTTLRVLGLLVESLPERHPVSDLFAQVFGRACTDPRDRVYGIHGLFPRTFQRFIPIDYTLPASQVYENAVAAHVKYLKRLELLRFCHLSKTLEESLPTWVFDLCSNLKMNRRFDTQFAAGFSASEARLDPHILTASGVYCATVTSVKEPMPDNVEVLESLRKVRGWEPADLDRGIYPTGETVRDAYASVLIGNWLQDRMPERIYDTWLREWRLQDSQTALFGDNANVELPSDAVPLGTEKFALMLLPKRTFLCTSEGYFGLGPTLAEQGDIIVVFLGCEAPILLRPQATNPTTYKVVGETLIYGLHDAIALLGNIPSPWRAQLRSDASGLFTKLSFLNSETGEETDSDPRLPPLESDWEAVQRERTAEDPRIFQAFRNKTTGAEQNSDPRMSADKLRERGVDLRSFVLI